jgi:hypothetical protein
MKTVFLRHALLLMVALAVLQAANGQRTVKMRPNDPNSMTGVISSSADGKITFELSVKGQTWLGFGVSPSKKMTNADIVYCASQSGGMRQAVFRTFSTAHAKPSEGKPVTDSECTFAGGFTTMKFTRSIAAGNSQEHAISTGGGKTASFIWAHGADSQTALQFHGQRKGILNFAFDGTELVGSTSGTSSDAPLKCASFQCDNTNARLESHRHCPTSGCTASVCCSTKVECATFECPTGQAMKVGTDSTKCDVTTSGACEKACCESTQMAKSKCKDFTCVVGTVKISGTTNKDCENNNCQHSCCKEPKTMCDSFTCPSKYVSVAGAENKECPYGQCDPSFCCQREEQKCDSFTCPTDFTSKANAVSITCNSGWCSRTECCDQKLTCMRHHCGQGYMQSPNMHTIECTSTQGCTDAKCCTPRPKCDGDAIVKPRDDWKDTNQFSKATDCLSQADLRANINAKYDGVRQTLADCAMANVADDQYETNRNTCINTVKSLF